MILAIHSDVLYLSKAGGKSQAMGHFYLTDWNDEDFNSGAVLALSSIIKHVMSSASKALLAVLYMGCKLAAPLPLRTTLEEMGHIQPRPTPITINNIIAQGLTMNPPLPNFRIHWYPGIFFWWQAAM
jgi:hypothetical protein